MAAEGTWRTLAFLVLISMAFLLCYVSLLSPDRPRGIEPAATAGENCQASRPPQPSLHERSRERVSSRQWAAMEPAPQTTARTKEERKRVYLERADPYSRDLIVVYTNNEFLSMAMNNFCALSSLDLLHRAVLFALDDQTCVAYAETIAKWAHLASVTPPPCVQGDVNITGLYGFASKWESPYLRILLQKAELVEEVVSAGLNIVLMDADVLMLQDYRSAFTEALQFREDPDETTPELDWLDKVIVGWKHRNSKKHVILSDAEGRERDMRNWDMLIQADRRPGYMNEGARLHEADRSTRWACAGFFYGRYSDASVAFFREVVKVIKEAHIGDQEAFQLLLTGELQLEDAAKNKENAEVINRYVAMARRRTSPPLKWRRLPSPFFPSGTVFPDLLKSYTKLKLPPPAVVHLNSMPHGQKLKMFKESQLWFLDSSAQYCRPPQQPIIPKSE
ncbi:hypothetical protein QOT17_014501 [Balamuthia mandrillaris]